MLPFHTYILAGGKSARFGSTGQDKARALLAGQPLITRLAQQLESLTASITVVAEIENKYADLNLNTIADHHPGRGPLAGLESALTHHQQQEIQPETNPAGSYLLLLSCDLVEIRTAWVNTLRHAAESPVPSSQDLPQVIAFVDPEDEPSTPGRIHPLPGLYHQSLLEIVSQKLRESQLGFQSLIRAVPHRLLPRPADWPATPQINTTTDWQNAQSQTPH